MKVFGIGNPLIDLIYRVEDKDLQNLHMNRGIMHLVDDPRRDEILTYLEGREIQYAPGGDVPNTMINLSLLGDYASFSGKIGNDSYGDMYETRLAACGVHSEIRKGEGKTGSSIILVSPDGERTMNTYLGMCREYSPEDINRQALMESDILYFTGYMWDTENQKEAINTAISLAQARDLVTIFDLADPFAVSRYRQDFLWLLERHVDIVFANAEEARLLMEDQDLESCLHKMSKLTPLVVIKDGPRGSRVFWRDKSFSVPAYPAEVHDTTGAGDTYASGFIHGLLKAMEKASGNILDLDQDAVKEAAQIAGYMASQVISRTGAQLNPSEITRVKKDLADFLHRV